MMRLMTRRNFLKVMIASAIMPNVAYAIEEAIPVDLPVPDTSGVIRYGDERLYINLVCDESALGNLSHGIHYYHPAFNIPEYRDDFANAILAMLHENLSSFGISAGMRDGIVERLPSGAMSALSRNAFSMRDVDFAYAHGANPVRLLHGSVVCWGNMAVTPWPTLNKLNELHTVGVLSETYAKFVAEHAYGVLDVQLVHRYRSDLRYMLRALQARRCIYAGDVLDTPLPEHDCPELHAQVMLRPCPVGLSIENMVFEPSLEMRDVIATVYGTAFTDLSFLGGT